jgi:hypothetical protein
MTRPSLHLSWAELACRDGTPYPVEWMDRLVVLAEIFEAIRAGMGGFPITPRSAYRTHAYNNELRRRGYKAARRSQHLEGRALDLPAPVQVSTDALWAWIRTYADTDHRVGGLGRYRTFVHIDTRTRFRGRLAVWDQVSADADLRAS